MAKKTEIKTKYYSLKRILQEKATYNMIIGIRSNGKTYAVQELGLKTYCETGKQMALIRRWQDDLVGKRGHQQFANMVNNGLVSKYSKGKWEKIVYKSSQWWLAKWDEKLNRDVLDTTPFCFGFALNVAEHDKSASFPNVTTVLFDEFLTRRQPLPEEFIEFTNVLSTIIRDRTDVTIFMCGNTVNKYSPYFAEMGLHNVKNQKPDTIDVYTYGNSDLKVAVEYCAISKDEQKTSKKASDFYFAFDNPKLQMITTGIWEISIYPHIPIRYIRKNVKLRYFIMFNREILQCDIVQVNKDIFTYIHRKTTDIQKVKKDLVYSTEYSPKPNWTRKITVPRTVGEQRIWWFYKNDKVFYQDNEVGEIVRNYILWCQSQKIA